MLMIGCSLIFLGFLILVFQVKKLGTRLEELEENYDGLNDSVCTCIDDIYSLGVDMSTYDARVCMLEAPPKKKAPSTKKAKKTKKTVTKND